MKTFYLKKHMNLNRDKLIRLNKFKKKNKEHVLSVLL